MQLLHSPLAIRVKNLIHDERNFAAGIFLIACTMLTVIWLGTTARIADEKKLTIENAVNDGNNIAAIVEANLNEVLSRADSYARRTRTLSITDRSVQSLNSQISSDPAYLRAAVFNAQTELLQSSGNRAVDPELQGFLLASLSQSPPLLQKGQLVIGRPSLEKNASWRVPVLIRFSSPQIPDGYFVAILDLGYILRFYKNVSLGERGRIEILMLDGYQLAEINGSSISGGVNYGASKYAEFLSETNHIGVVKHQRPDTSSTEVSVFRISQQFPFAVVVRRDEGDLERQLTIRTSDYLVRAAIVSFVLTLLMTGLFIVARRQRRLNQGLKQSEREKLDLIVQLEQEKGRAVWQATHDYLTGIPNRMLFYELAEKELARARRSRKLYAVMFLDLDKFKKINDALGHTVGDLLLQSVSQRLQSSLREYDLLARFGGDEFVILISEMISEADISKVAAKLIDVISQTYQNLNGEDVDVSPSIGIALYPRDGQGLDALLTHADSAMYMAKSAGAGTFRFFDKSLNSSSARDSDLLLHFKRAIKKNEFCLHFQPRISLNDYSVCGLEALIRWQHPEYGLIYPNDFIPLAENNDLIVPLGCWVIEAACRQIAEWNKIGLPPTPVAINVSPKQLRNDALITTVIASLERYQVPPEMLEIEVTEGCFIEDFDAANYLLQKLKNLGIKIALDDYGTGFSSLKHLTKLPIYAIKIDRSFIHDIRNDASDAVIVASTITLAHNLGLEVVAEGVESREQLMHLKTAGCDYVQGFYFQRPVSGEEILPTLVRGQFTPL